MALKAAAYHLVVSPSGDNDQTEKGRIIIVQNEAPDRKVYRGVVEHVGREVHDDISSGDVAHYTAFHELGEKHVVPHQNLVAFEDDE